MIANDIAPAALCAQERMTVLDFGRGPLSPYERNATIAQRFEHQVRTTPDAFAVRSADTSLTYRELERRANRLAHYLSSLGVQAGTAVGVAFERSLALPISVLAILKLGGVYVPLDPAYPRERIAFMLADADVRLVISERALCAQWPSEAAPVIELDTCAAQIACASDTAPVVAARPLSAAYIMYTSGSTGRPKGVAVPHRAVLRLVRGADYVNIRPDDVFVQLAPLGFDASTFELWAPLLNGALLAIPPAGLLSLEQIGREVTRFGVTTAFFTPSLFNRLADSASPAFEGLRHVLSGGDVASPSHMRRFLERYGNCRLSNVYGPTENTTFSTMHDVALTDLTGAGVPIGRPIANSSAYVLDERLAPVAPGVLGELCVGGDGIALGYLHDAERTDERFVPDPFSDSTTARLYRTGDRACFRADGVLEFHGRSDDQLKIRGFRIELGEIEAALNSLHAVGQAAVVAIETTPAEKSLVACIVAATGVRLDENDLRVRLRERLPAYLIPHEFALVDSIPHYRSGKIDRVGLAREQSERRRGVQGAAPTPTPAPASPQRIVEELWRDVLHAPAAPPGDCNFFDAGGDSLRLLRLLDLLNARFSLALGVVDLFEHTTIAAQAALVDRLC